MDTIFALATAPGRAGVAVIRMSGPASFDVLQSLAGDVPEPRVMSLRVLRDPSGVQLDEALVVAFAEGASFTGDPSVEFHLHGGPAVVQAVLKELAGRSGCRFAEAGEFTRRAFQNGRLDLTQVEALADVIDAETEAQRKQALAILSGALSDKVAVWRQDVIKALALLDAGIDFSDEEIPDDLMDQAAVVLRRVFSSLSNELSGLRSAERIRDGFEVAIIGPPNAGKSTLLNYLAGREAAITSDIPGTTRDIIDVRLDLDGLPVTFLDTAGLRATEDVVEKIGVERAIARAKAADLRVHLVKKGSSSILNVEDGDIVVEPKSDTTEGGVGVSGLTGRGVPELLDHISKVLGERVATAGLVSRERHRIVLTEARAGLKTVLDSIDAGEVEVDLISEDVREVARRLEMLIGRVDVESVLDDIFSSFCLGK